MPIDDEILKYLIAEEIVEEGTTLEDAQKFVEHSIKVDEAYDTYMSLRRAATGGKKKGK